MPGTTIGIKSGLHLPEWRPLAGSPVVFAVGLGLCHDMRNNEDRHPEIIQLSSANQLLAYQFKVDGWVIKNATSIAMGGTSGAGNCTEFSPSRGPRGSITAYDTGGTPAYYKLTLGATVLPSAGVTFTANSLANRGGGIGYKIRLIGNRAGGSGKISEHRIIMNTAGTTPVVYLDSAPSFTPANGDSYEILSGGVMVITGGAAAANDCKTIGMAAGTVTVNANKPNAAGTDSALLCLDELYVPYDREPGEGLLGVMTATAMGAGSLTGQAANTLNDGDANVAANEFKNFQVRIVEDVATPTAVGQRRSITSHTAGVSPVYTLRANWTVQPSATAKYVIENPNWWLWVTQAQTFVSVFREAGFCDCAATTWDNTILTGRAAVAGVGCMLVPTFGVEQDNQIPVADAANRVCRYSHVHGFRGTAGGVLDIINIAAQTITATAYDSGGATFTTGASYTYDPATQEGRFAYINASSQYYTYRYDVYSRTLDSFAQIPVALGTMVVGQRMACLPFVDPNDATKVARVFMFGIGAVGFWDIVVTGY
jgi:hypothetical protein